MDKMRGQILQLYHIKEHTTKHICVNG